MLDGGVRLAGFTANAFSSVSLDPPLVLICVNYRARSYAHLLDSQTFTIHILNGDQTWIAQRFAEPGVDKSTICPWFVNEREFPILFQYRAALECRLFREYEGGDHAIIVGKVERLHTHASEIEPLIFYGGQLFPLGREDDEHGGALHDRDARSTHTQSPPAAE
jgi:flavin reductase (DIM6/NTAB) family NADH-FMN oxidoreductase RutF